MGELMCNIRDTDTHIHGFIHKNLDTHPNIRYMVSQPTAYRYLDLPITDCFLGEPDL